jgi:trafficking protein particle complex subunit 11
MISSMASPDSKPIRISEIKLTFEGNYRMMVLRDSKDSEASEKMVKDGNLTYVDLKGQLADHDSSNSPLMSPTHQRNYSASITDLSLSPNENKIFELSTVLREAGEVRSISATLCIVTDDYDLELIYELEPDDYRVSEELEIGSNIGIGSRKSIRTGHELTPDGGNGVWHYIKDEKIHRRPIRTADPNTLR